MSNCTFVRPVEVTSVPRVALSVSRVALPSTRVAPSSTRMSLSVPTTTTSWRDSLVVPMTGTGLGTADAHHNSIAKPKNSIAKPKAAAVPAAGNAPAKAGVAYGAAKQAAPPRGIPR